MSVLNSLKLVTAKRPQSLPAIQVRRNKLSNKLYEQIKLATALNEGKTYSPLRLRTFRNKETGEIKSIDVPQRIRQWWFTSDTGKVCIQVKYGSRTIDISKGTQNKCHAEYLQIHINNCKCFSFVHSLKIAKHILHNTSILMRPRPILQALNLQ